MTINLSFKGVTEPYETKSGYKITPIAEKPLMRNVKEAIKAAKALDSHSGLNGRAYYLGEDLIVKKYMPLSEAANYNPEREISALDLMYEKGVKNENIQQGMYAFKTPEGGEYLVSSRIKGARPDIKNNPFNKNNLNALVSVLCDLDMPHRTSETGFFPYEIPMHYDLAPGNIVISDKSAGLIDFEYLKFENLDIPLFNQLKGKFDCHCDYSDIAGIPSNLRNFEYRTLYKYMMNQKPEEAEALLKDYLKAKSSYHEKRSEFYNKEAQKAMQQQDKTHTALYSDLSLREKAHAQMLKTDNQDVLKSEILKIQLADFIYTQSPFSHSGKEKINIRQIKDYLKNAEDFFRHKRCNAENVYEAVYYKDCLQLIDNWKGVIGWMDWQQYLLDKLIFAAKNEDYNYISKYKEDAETARIFGKKLTDEKQKTLDEHILRHRLVIK